DRVHGASGLEHGHARRREEAPTIRGRDAPAGSRETWNELDLELDRGARSERTERHTRIAAPLDGDHEDASSGKPTDGTDSRTSTDRLAGARVRRNEARLDERDGTRSRTEPLEEREHVETRRRPAARPGAADGLSRGERSSDLVRIEGGIEPEGERRSGGDARRRLDGGRS